MENVAVFLGGTAPEKEISLITGVLTLNSLDKQKYNPIPIFIDGNGEWYSGEALFELEFFKKKNYSKIYKVVLPFGGNTLYKLKGKKLKEICKIKVAINCIHGEGGEDGGLAGIIKNCDIAFASPPLYSASLSMDKEQTKIALKGLKIRALPYCIFESDSKITLCDKGINFPVIVKPNLGGSSIGIGRADNYRELERAVKYALKFGNKVLVEPYIEGFKEINCACYMGKNGRIVTSQCERPVRKEDILSFDDKYSSGGRIFPADINPNISQRIRNLTQRIYRELGFFGIIRIDYILKDGVVYLNEINSVPGSLACYLFGKSLTTFTEILSEIIEYSKCKYNSDKSVVREFPSNILDGVGSKSAKTVVK